jgi:hypothetical protein
MKLLRWADDARNAPASSLSMPATVFQRFMNQLEKLSAHVKSYFLHPKVQYAAALSL